ncbi:Disease resistance protein RPS5 [Citrus sinensis]|uniref:Disease resistance protein RPS5 n=1 Tax=Citrus sinensis TaxID=2711 RepID=A0ACB8JBC7_CITSI|nr:Disease resistance protein RPS5 [Citrus sinensis]
MMRGYSATNETAGASARVAFKSARTAVPATRSGKKVFETLQQVQGLTNEGDFKEVAQRVPENPVDERPLPPTVVGLQSTFDRIWRCLMEEQMGIVGLYGMGEVGLPVPCRTSASNKIVFTAREFEVCGQMEAQKSFKVERLGYEGTWKLFEEKVGKEILDSHPDIPELAETVAKECGGLPLALITVGRAMASKKTPREWQHAIEVLRSSAYKFSGMESRVFSRLKLSYDFLSGDETRFYLPYCSSYPEDYKIFVEDLIDCWICEGFLDEYDGFEARNQGYSVIRVLLHACLLVEEEDNHVKMHDVIRDMALWIASTIDKDKEKFLVLAGVGLTEPPRTGLWNAVTRMSLMRNKITRLLESPPSPLLQTLSLSSNDLYTDSGSILFGDGHVFVKELLGLSHLQVLTVTLKCFDALEILLSSPGLKSTRTPALCFRRCEKTLRVFPLRHPEPFTLWSVMVAVCYRR